MLVSQFAPRGRRGRAPTARHPDTDQLEAGKVRVGAGHGSSGDVLRRVLFKGAGTQIYGHADYDCSGSGLAVHDQPSCATAPHSAHSEPASSCHLRRRESNQPPKLKAPIPLIHPQLTNQQQGWDCPSQNPAVHDRTFMYLVYPEPQ
jgi:hypothetical protein